MCLSKVTARFDPPETGVKKGYKLVTLKRDVLKRVSYRPYLYWIGNEFKITKNKWYEAYSGVVINQYVFEGQEQWPQYHSGFHILETLEDAKKFIRKAKLDHSPWAIVEVDYDEVATKGFESVKGDIATVVANKIRYTDKIVYEGPDLAKRT